jgi:hypothetical protein
VLHEKRAGVRPAHRTPESLHLTTGEHTRKHVLDGIGEQLAFVDPRDASANAGAPPSALAVDDEDRRPWKLAMDRARDAFRLILIAEIHDHRDVARTHRIVRGRNGGVTPHTDTPAGRGSAVGEPEVDTSSRERAPPQGEEACGLIRDEENGTTNRHARCLAEMNGET